MRQEPVLFDDLQKAITKLPTPETFPDDTVSIEIKDGLTRKKRYLLFMRRTFFNAGGKEERFWTLFQTIGFPKKEKSKKVVKEA